MFRYFPFRRPDAFPPRRRAMIAVWKRPQRDAEHAPLVVVLHGRGADEHDLLGVIERLPSSFSYVSLRALVSVAEGGYTWFENRGVARPVPKSLGRSVDTLRAWLDQTAPARKQGCYLLGFSAGMMMAGALLLADPQRFAGAVLLSGALPFDCGIAAEDGRLAGIPIFHGHGRLDTVIPADLVSRTSEYLHDRSGAELTERSYEHAHSIALREIHDIAQWLAERR